MKTPEAMATWPAVRALFPSGEPLSVKRTSWRSNANIGQPPMLSLEETYDYPDRVLAAQVTMSQAGGPHLWQIRGIHVGFQMKAPGAAGALPPSSAPSSSSAPAPSSAPASQGQKS